jgi:filamentous hemagglutinin family protein
LFQSFGIFNLNAGEIANFESTGNIRNILSRVTGGSGSLIDGLISTNSANVNLFFINPSGIVFGPNARLMWVEVLEAHLSLLLWMHWYGQMVANLVRQIQVVRVAC